MLTEYKGPINYADRVAKLDAHRLLYDPELSHEAEALLQNLNHVRDANNLDPLTLNPLGETPLSSPDGLKSTLYLLGIHWAHESSSDQRSDMPLQ